jgi:hypothetical protein
MSTPILIEAILYGGPVDGVKILLPENLGCVLAALRNEVHGYAWANRSEAGRWVYKHTRLLATTGEGTRAAEILRAKGQPVVELVVDESAK